MGRPEPAAVAAAVKEALSAVVKLLVVFAVIHMTAEQFGVLMIAVDAILSAFMVLFIRARVTPIADPLLVTGTEVKVLDPTGNIGTTTL